MNRSTPTQRALAGRAPGFTLIELMVTLSVLGVLAGLAAPGFASAIQRQRVASAAEHLAASLAHARWEAIRHGRTVVVRRVEPCSANVLASDWRCGWRTFVDLNGNDRPDAGETVLQEAAGNSHAFVRSSGSSFIGVTRFGVFNGTGIQVYPAGGDGSLGQPITNNRRLCLWGSRVNIVSGVSSC